jgi:hypothetical protein
MRGALRGSLLSLVLAGLVLPVLLAACEPPPSHGTAGAAVVAPPPAVEPLPEAVAATVQKLKDIAATGSYRDLARLAGETPGFRSNNAGMSHQDYWYLKMRAGDWPMAQADKLFAYRYAVARSRGGKVYVWPWMALLKPDEITPAAAREIDRLLGEGQAEALRKGGVWPGYVLGIAEDGAWLYFVSGSG